MMCGSTGLRIAIWKTLQDGGGIGGVEYSCMWVLFADVNLWLMGLSSTSLTMLRLRSGGDPP